MQKVNYFDFTIKSDEYEDIVFRFFPRDSHCHSFDDQPPYNWNGVYKVYYSYAIVSISKDEDESFGEVTYEFTIYRDECSVLTDLSKYIKGTLFSKKKSKAYSMGQPGSEWEIFYENNKIKFVVFDSFNNNGYRFWLSYDRAEQFAAYLDMINDYMLKHGEPI